jgi:HK97 family phage major capsid protein
MNEQQLINERASIWDKMQALMDTASGANRELSAEESQTYDRLEADLDAKTAQIERVQKHQNRSTGFNQVDRTGVVAPAAPDVDSSKDEEYADVFNRFLRSGIGAMAPEDQRTMQNALIRDPGIQNAAGVGTGSAGGYAVPLAFRDKFVETMKWYGPMLNVAEVITTDSGVNLPWPTNDDTANVGAILGENTQVTEQDVTLGTASLDAYMYTSKLVRVSLQLLQDRPDFDTWLARKLGERVGRILNQHFTTGTGTAQPDGIVTSATVGVTGTGSFATTGGLSYDNLVDLTEALDPAYGGGQGLQFMIHQTARKALRKIKDTTGQPLWQPSLQLGTPDTVLGYGVLINNDMPTLAQSSKSILFGNISQAYVARLVTGLSTLRLTERYADFLQVGFLAFQRADGTMQDANAVRVFQTTATA